MTNSHIGSALAKSLVEALSDRCDVAQVIASRLEAGVSYIPANLPVEGYPPQSIEQVAEDFVRRGWLKRNGHGWESVRQPPAGLSAFLLGAATMRRALPATARTSAVVTMPAAPSAVALALPSEGPIHATLRATDETMADIARAAVRSLTIMSPFVNEEGAELVLRLFQVTSAHERRLITRQSGATRRALNRVLPDLKAENVTVLNYLLPADGGYETFHAKVVLADRDVAYVGSANMTLYARHSMELGMIVEGQPARAVASIVRAVVRISQQIGGTC